MADITEINRQRGYVKARLTNVVKAVKAFKPGDNVSVLKTRLTILEGIYAEFNTCQRDAYLKIHDLLKDEALKKALEAHEREDFDFETEYCNIVAEIQKMIEPTVVTTPASGSRASSATSSNGESKAKTHIELPKYELPSFSGDLARFMSFHDSFKSLIHESEDLSPIQKFHYLKSCLKGEAARIIEPFVLSSANYDDAWKAVVKRFKNDRLIIQKHVFNIYRTPDISKANHASLRQLLGDITVNLAALKAFKIETETWNVFMVPILAEKLDYVSKREWQALLTSEVPRLEDFAEFLEKRCILLESMQNPCSTAKPSNATQSGKQNQVVKAQAHVALNKRGCAFCQDTAHIIYNCQGLLNLTVRERIEEVQKLKLCANCLKRHEGECKSANKCKLCREKHNTLLHRVVEREIREERPSTSTSSFISRQTHHSVLLSTAIILVKDKNNKYQECRALLDQGSQSNFITKHLVNKLGVRSEDVNVSVTGITQRASHINEGTRISVGSKYNQFRGELNCLIVPQITGILPNFKIDLAQVKIPQDIILADPNFHEPRPVDMLIGAQMFWEILSNGHKAINPKGPHLRETQFGWIIGGQISSSPRLQGKTVCNFSVGLEEQVEKFWKIEELPASKPLTDEEQFCENHFRNTIKRDNEGRFVAELPCRDGTLKLGSSSDIATRRLYALEKKLDKNPELKQQYVNFMQEYEHLGHMERVPVEEINKENTCYLPHHAVLKQDSATTKLRVVFDASAKTTNGESLNDNLLAGPTVQQDLFSILIRFRTFKYVINADIQMMYRQIKIQPEQRDLQRILWRENRDEPVQIYRLKTLTYGTKPASFVATRCLIQLADENESAYVKASEIIRRDFYMDDLLTGANSVKEAVTLSKEITEILAQAGLKLRKWASNDPRTLKGLHNKSPNDTISLGNDTNIKVLGVAWNCKNDVFKYKWSSEKSNNSVTKRTILSVLAQNFDPLGFLSPIIIRGKIIMQQLWAEQIGWDDEIPEKIKATWAQLVDEFHYLSDLNIPRNVISDTSSSEIEVHGFCDSSERAYGAVLYIRVTDRNGTVTTKLLCAKSRIAPLKTISIPRLELCGALLLARLLDNCTQALEVPVCKRVMWTDSTIVLSWLKASPNTWKTFVANRVTEINERTRDCEWRHVVSSDNPADIVSRGAFPCQINDMDLWWHGPRWLTTNPSKWPHSYTEVEETEAPEKRSINLVIRNAESPELFDKFSSFETLRRTIAYCLRFANNCKRKNVQNRGSLTTNELRNATKAIVKSVQTSEFADELTNNATRCKSKLHGLDPFVDQDGILRVGGRLRQAGSISYDKKHPAILPKNHHVSELLIRQEHERQLHAGAQATLAGLRHNYWILSGRSSVRKITGKCVRCFKTRPTAITQKMGDLPYHRLEPLRPFFKTGVDFAGPILIKPSAGRTKLKIKTYIAIFVCFATKAIHVELAGDLSAETFLNAFKRLTARRGHVGHLFCDNATNFVGAKNKLKGGNKMLDLNLGMTNTEFHFIPPRSPNFGGLWEAAVKSVKNHLIRVIGDASLTYEELYTLLVRVEACVNSRPLTPLSTDPNDLSALTPGHFLIGEPLTAIPEGDLGEIQINRLSRWQRIEQLRQHFWKRWSREYLTQLQGRPKWHREATDRLTEGALAIIKEDNLPPLQWSMGRIVRLLPGKDGLARVAVLKTCRGEVTRPIRKLCLLPID